MSKNHLAAGFFSLFFGACLVAGLSMSAAAQCGGTYFKRLSTNLVPYSGFLSETVDLTGDGIDDLIGAGFTNLQNGYDKIIILPANGTGGFASPIVINSAIPQASMFYRYGNFDGDNLKDVIAVYNTSPQSIQIHKNNGNGTFTAQPLTVVEGEVKYLLDINNDGKGDLITGVQSPQSTARYQLGNGDGTFAAPVGFTQGSDVRAADFNGDNKIDFLVGVRIYVNQGSGIFTNVDTGISLGSSEYIQDVRDFTGDGKLDFVTVMNQTTVKLGFLKNNGDTTFTRTDYTVATDQQNGNLYGTVFVGNFGGNGSPDIVFSQESAKKTRVYTNDGTGVFTVQSFDYKFNGNAIVDLDNDGKSDLLKISNSGNGIGGIKLFNHINVTVQKNVCNQPGQPRIFDVKRDSTTDLAYWKPADGKWNIDGAAGTVNWGLGSLGDIPTPGDFDGDGITDVAVFRNPTGEWWVRRSSDLVGFTITFGTAGDKPVVGDYDGDSISDIAVFRPSDGTWYVLFMGPQTFTIANWGQNGDVPVPEDYDGDGKTDLAVFRPSTGVWYYFRSSNGSFAALNFGLSTDKPVPADYDGDGKADLAVYRGSESVLHVLRSYNFGYAAFQFGVSGDLPQPGDYDGDFVFDFGIYRPSSQSWYVTPSIYQNVFGEPNIVPVSSILRIE